MPLAGITADVKDRNRAISIILRQKEPEHLTHIVSEPKYVRLKQSAEGADEALAIESADGINTVAFSLPYADRDAGWDAAMRDRNNHQSFSGETTAREIRGADSYMRGSLTPAMRRVRRKGTPMRRTKCCAIGSEKFTPWRCDPKPVLSRSVHD